MSKIVSIIPEVGLKQWVDDDGKHCQSYKYNMIIERDNGSLELHPIVTLDNIDRDSAEGIIKWHDDDKVQMINYVDTALFNEYVKSEVDFEVENCAWTIASVIQSLQESKVRLSDELIEPLRELKKQLNKLFKDK